MTPYPGDFAVVSAGGLAGKFVRIGQWLNGAGKYSDYEHAFIYTGELGDHAIIQAEPKGADYAKLTPHAKTLWSTGHFDLTAAQREASPLGLIDKGQRERRKHNANERSRQGRMAQGAQVGRVRARPRHASSEGRRQDHLLLPGRALRPGR